MFYYPKEAYEIQESLGRYRVLRPNSSGPSIKIAVHSADTLDGALCFIRRFSEPRAYPSTYFDDSCHCGYVKEGWDFLETDGIIFEFCNKCKRPIYEQDRKKLNKQSMDEFDLDAFLNM